MQGRKKLAEKNQRRRGKYRRREETECREEAVEGVVAGAGDKKKRMKKSVETSQDLHLQGVEADVAVLEEQSYKYDKYDVEKQRDLNVSGDDAFARLYAAVESDIESALQKAETAGNEKNRALVVAINVEIRRTKAKLLEEIPKLQLLAMKKV